MPRKLQNDLMRRANNFRTLFRYGYGRNSVRKLFARRIDYFELCTAHQEDSSDFATLKDSLNFELGHKSCTNRRFCKFQTCLFSTNLQHRLLPRALSVKKGWSLTVHRTKYKYQEYLKEIVRPAGGNTLNAAPAGFLSCHVWPISPSSGEVQREG